MEGKIYHNLGDQPGRPNKLYYGPLSSDILISIVPNYYDANIGVSFYTALPQRTPTWQAILFVFQVNVWLPLIMVIASLGIMLKILLIYPDYSSAVTWLFHALTGKGIAMETISAKKRAAIPVIVLWTMVAAVLSYSYAGALISTLTSPSFETLPHTWQDLLDRNYALKSMTHEVTGENIMGSIFLFAQAETEPYKEIYKRLNTDFGNGNKFPKFHR